MPNTANSARSVPLTVFTLITSSSAIRWLLAGVAYCGVLERPAQRDEDAALGRGQQLADVRADRRHSGARGGAAGRRAEHDDSRADGDRVAVAQSAAARDPLAVDPRAVMGDPVVHDRPLLADALERSVDPRHARVPVEHDVVARAPADREARRRRAEVDQHLLAGAGAVDEERRAAALGGDAVAQFLGAGDVRVERRA